MATIITKNSSTASSVPTNAQLVQGELAVNVTDKRLFTENASGTVVELGTNPSSLTLPNGSVNGIPYLNGSKVLTTNSALQFDGSNLGLGVTPSAWGGSFKSFEQQGGNIASNSTDNLRLVQNAYYNGTSWIYKTTAAATRYDQQGGWHNWFVAPSGTAGNAISFTQAMTLDASGFLTVPAQGKSITFGSTANESGVGVQLLGTAAQKTWMISSNFFNGGALQFTRSTAAGGTTYSTPDVTIDSSGNLLVGQTSNTGLVNSNSMIYFPGSLGAQYMSHASGSASGSVYIGFGYNASTIGSITQNGTTGVLYNLTSDYRLKNNPVPVTGAKEFINALQPKTWDWWDGSGKGVGFIAHEFMEVAKYSGNGTKDAVDDDGNPVYQSIQPSSSEVMANLVAYVQELRAEFDAYKASHP